MRIPGGAASASLRVDLPNRRADLAENVPILLDDEALRALMLIPDAYAGALSGMVFAPALREAWQRALGYAEGTGKLMRARLHLLGALLQTQGDLAGARPYYERALAITEQVLGPQHPDTVTSLWWMADIARRIGEVEQTRPLYTRTLAVFTKR